VEFPIYFNYFIKKAFLNPENRIILIGSKGHLERIKTVFSESFFGPDEKFLYIHEEIDPELKKMGYSVGKSAFTIHKNLDFRKEKSTFDGSDAKLSNFANFITLDEFGSASIEEKTSDSKVIQLKVTFSSGFLQVFENERLIASVDTIPPLIPLGTNVLERKQSLAKAETQSVFVPPTFGTIFIVLHFTIFRCYIFRNFSRI
jgi:hypothetical protein